MQQTIARKIHKSATFDTTETRLAAFSGEILNSRKKTIDCGFIGKKGMAILYDRDEPNKNYEVTLDGKIIYSGANLIDARSSFNQLFNGV